MKAPYNMQVNGWWYKAGEEIPEPEPEAKQEVIAEVAQVEEEAVIEEAPKPARKRSRKAVAE